MHVNLYGTACARPTILHFRVSRNTAPDTFYQYPGPVFGAGAAGAVFRDIE